MTMRTAIVVDDEPITRMDISGLLQEIGFTVLSEAGDGFDAIELCRRHQPDVVMMDIKMPIFNGIQAAKTIVEEEIAGCVVLLTAFSDDELIAKATAAGVTGYLVKPIEERLIQPAIEVAFAQSTRLREIKKQQRKVEQRLEESRVVEQAKRILAREHGIHEKEAYDMIRKKSMDKRIPIAELASAIVENDDEKLLLRQAKECVMKKYQCSEPAAYKKIRELAKQENRTVYQVIQKILRK